MLILLVKHQCSRRKIIEVVDLYLELRDSGRRFLWYNDILIYSLLGFSSCLIYNIYFGARLLEPNKLQGKHLRGEGRGELGECRGHGIHRIYIKSPES